MHRYITTIRRHSLVVIVFFVGVLLYGLAIRALWNYKNNEIHEITQLNTQTRADALQRDIEAGAESTQILKYVLKGSHQNDIPYFDALSQELMTENSSIASLQLAPDGKVARIYPFQGNEAGLIDLFADKKRGPVVVYSRDHAKMTIQGPFSLKQGGQGMAVRNPVYFTDANGMKYFWGFTIAIIKVPEVFRQTIDTLTSFGYDFALYKTDPTNDVYQFITSSTDSMEDPVITTFEAGGSIWRLEVMPANGWHIMESMRMYIFVGAVFVILFTLMTYFIVLLNRDRKLFRRMSRHDQLTGLLNHWAFLSQEKTIQLEKKPYGIFYIDVNYFKQVNDTYGHDAGDMVLKEVAVRLRRIMPYAIFRMGGDEFLILVTGHHSKAAYESLASRIVKAFHEPIVSENLELPVTVSVGYARHPEDAANLKDLCEIADGRMYKEKKKKHQIR